MKCSVRGKLSRDLVPEVFIGTGHVTFYWRMCQNSRLPEEKQEFSIIYIFPYHLGIGIHSYQGLMGIHLKFEFPNASETVSLVSRAF